ncbi:MAG: hypothetical protein A4S12_00550 [Proteobacteria bacterium SG_bin5]|nr:MAG: hypothetical protein A4S12_00550 [Proteobacteria bacterium SG_bin5]
MSSESETKTADSVAKIAIGWRDTAGAIIRAVYAKAVPYYAIYGTDERIVVQHADAGVIRPGASEPLATEQRKALAPLAKLRGEINGLIDQWRNRRPDQPDVTGQGDEPRPPGDGTFCWLWSWLMGDVRRWRDYQSARRYDRRCADALHVALQGDAAFAEAMLADVKRDVIAERMSLVRVAYFVWAACTMALMVGVAGPIADWAIPRIQGIEVQQTRLIWRGGSIGAVGALFSIALAIRGRDDIGIGLDFRDYRIDAVLRVLIGATSGVLILCFLSSGLIFFNIGPQAGAGGGTRSGLMQIIEPLCVPNKSCPPVVGMTSFAALLAFAAGFTERLTSNLLTKFGSTIDVVNGPTAAAAGTRQPTSPSDAGTAPANEVNPLGLPPEPEAEADEGDERRHDHCVADKPLSDDEATDDVHLPEASGGIAIAPPAPANPTPGK